MDIVHSAIKRLEARIEGSGSEEGIVRIDTDPDRVICQYEKGACLKAAYGGRSSEFVTMDPLTATTRIGFMFGARLERLNQRAAACAILNVVAGFFCISRVLKSCPPESHRECLAVLRGMIGNSRVFLIGIPPAACGKFDHVVNDADAADIILIVGDGLIQPGTGELIEKYRGLKQFLFLSPSTGGASALLGCEHWCPFGRA
ncbi:MAG: hypothetical protein LUQ33_04200 [Methanoregulaceae archaeon]|jgi:hypothetical protein|nr:hypothetical protein [Methanoregulaceae archaeon]